MERVQGVNFQRIEWCCQQAGISPEQLASDLGISQGTMDRARAGEGSLTFKQLKRLAAHFGRGMLFFLEPGPVDEQQVYTPQFRTLANQKTNISPKVRQLIERAERQRDLFLSLRENLDDDDRPRFDPPEIPHDPSAAARIARRWLALNNQSSFEEYRAAVEARGILVFRSNGYNGQWQIPQSSAILGFSLYDKDCPLIVVRKEFAPARQTFTLMHELGHVLLHKSSSIDDESDLYSQNGHEREANAFAGHLLVPDDLLNHIDDADRPANAAQYDTWLDEPRRAWGVSSEVILRRLLDSGRLAQVHYDAYKQWQAGVVYPQRSEGGVRMYRHREPRHIFGDTFVRTVLEALDAQQISLSKASTYLDRLRIDDLHKLEQLYASR